MTFNTDNRPMGSLYAAVYEQTGLVADKKTRLERLQSALVALLAHSVDSCQTPEEADAIEARTVTPLMDSLASVYGVNKKVFRAAVEEAAKKREIVNRDHPPTKNGEVPEGRYPKAFEDLLRVLALAVGKPAPDEPVVREAEKPVRKPWK